MLVGHDKSLAHFGDAGYLDGKTAEMAYCRLQSEAEVNLFVGLLAK